MHQCLMPEEKKKRTKMMVHVKVNTTRIEKKKEEVILGITFKCCILDEIAPHTL